MIVVDASVAIKWFIAEPGSIQAIRLYERSEVLIAPDLILYEVGNIAWKRVTRGELTPGQADQIIERLPKMLDGVLGASAVISMAVDIAVETGASVYDASYAALAAILGVPFVTADERLKRKLARLPWAHLVQVLA